MSRALTVTVVTLVAFLVTLVSLIVQIRMMRGSRMMARDMNKPHSPLIPEMGGLSVMVGFYASIQVLFILGDIDYPLMYGAVFTIFAVGMVGILDDLFHLRQLSKAFLPALVAVPFALYMVTYDTTLRIPLLDLNLEVGWFMVVIVPIAITSAANSANMLEGLNGLGAGIMLIIALALTVGSAYYAPNNAIFLTAPLLGALAAFLVFNVYPARIFPGDTLTLFAGATLCAAAMIGQMKLLGGFLFLLLIVEFFLKLKGLFQAQNFGHLDSKGNLRYKGPIQSLTHLMMKFRPAPERIVVLRLWALQIVLAFVVMVVIFVTRPGPLI